VHLHGVEPHSARPTGEQFWQQQLAYLKGVGSARAELLAKALNLEYFVLTSQMNF